MSEFQGLAHMGIYTKNADVSKQFYRDNLGFQVKEETNLTRPDGSSLRLIFLEQDGLLLELVEPGDKSQVPGEPRGLWEHLALRVQNLPAIIERLKRAGVIFETDKPRLIPHLLGGIKVIFLKGPSGERIELVEYL